jgi:N-hydroxyarylamine O-acetyltransferase
MTITGDLKTTSFSANRIIPEAYFHRINYRGSTLPTIETLRDLHIAHTKSIPFENLNPLLRIPVRLDIDSIQQKIIHESRGGYCFEQNTLLTHVLRQLGFEVRGLAARVLWNSPPGTITPRGHMLLKIRISGRDYIADTGFGGLTLPEPIIFQTDVVQNTTHENFRIVERGDEYELQAFVQNEWKSLYLFSLLEHVLADYEVPNYYLSTHTNSHFLHNLIAARISEGRRYALRNAGLTIHTRDATEKREINSVDELKHVLENIFGIRLPQSPVLEETFERILGLRQR